MAGFSGERVLVTGAGGFIGSHLAKRLVKEGAQVLALSRNPWRLEEIEKKAQVKPVDLTDSKKLRTQLKTFDPQRVFHLAAITTVDRDPALSAKMVEANVIGTINLLEACLGLSVESIVNTGTCEEYGNNPAPFTEEMLPLPPSPYAASKVAATTYARMYYDAFGLPTLTLRPFFTYGPGQEEGRFLSTLIRTLLGGREFSMTGGKQTREYNYVDDVVEGFLLASRAKTALGETINLGCGQEISVLEVAEKVHSMVGKGSLKVGALPYRKNEVWRLFCSNEKAKKLLGWKALTPLEEGLRKTIAWYEANPSPVLRQVD